MYIGAPMATDRLLQIANHPATARLVRALGLPQPRVLPRRGGAWQEREFAGRAALVLAAARGFAAEACRQWLADAGAQLAAASALQAIVLDATGCASVSSLGALRELLAPALARLASGGRVLLLADGAAATVEAQACARGIEGFTRSLARELGRRGATANCVLLDEGSLLRLQAPLSFFCGDRSAYVSGQVQRLTGEVRALPPAAGQRTAVVTGAAGGIGAATARRLAADGLRVVCADVPLAATALDALAREIGGQALPLDITAPDAGACLVAAIGERGVDVLVHNAGITRDRTLARMSEAEWNDVLAVNLRTVLALDAALDAAGALREGAREVCLSSISGIAGNAGQTNYALTKAALIGYVAARSQQLAPRGITVNAVAPGFIETAMTRGIPFFEREVGRRLNSLAQAGQPEDVAEAIAFLARPQAQGVSGQVLRVCGQSYLGA